MADRIKHMLEEGLAYHRAGRVDEAVSLYRTILERDPDNPDALHLLGIISSQAGEHTEGEALIRRALTIRPNAAVFHDNLGQAVARQKRWQEAAVHHRNAIELTPDFGEAWYGLGIAVQALGDFATAESAFQKARSLLPHDARVAARLGSLFDRTGRFAEAAACLNQAVQLAPDDAGTHAALGRLLGQLGISAESIEAFRRSLQLKPGDLAVRDRLIFQLLASPLALNGDIAEELAAYSRFHNGCANSQFANTREPDRRLRLGYLSGGLAVNHNLLYVMDPLLRAHDRGQFEIFLYGDVPYGNTSQAPIRALADTCHDISALDDAAVAEQIRSDRIDILISVLGRGSRGPRHTVLFQRPAPVQMAYQWVGSTGIPQVDYWISDETGVPTDTDEPFFETVLRLPQFLTFRPPSGFPTVSPLPAIKNGFVTYASFANTFKLNDAVFATWRAILTRVQKSRLILKSEALGDLVTRTLVETRLRRADLPMDRVSLWPPKPTLFDHLRQYHEVDISLDTFPYTFGNTALESLWMGVPVVSLSGPRFAHRITASILHAANFPDLVVSTPDRYVQKATELGTNFEALARWRSSARERISTSRLMDYAGHTRVLEQAYRTAWKNWCGSHIAGQ